MKQGIPEGSLKVKARVLLISNFSGEGQNRVAVIKGHDHLKIYIDPFTYDITNGDRITG